MSVHLSTDPLRPFEDIFFGGASRLVRCCQIALVERTNLIRFESPNNGVKHATVMEEDEVPFLPVVGVDHLHYVSTYDRVHNRRQLTCGAIAGRWIV